MESLRFRRRTAGEILAMVDRFCQYHDLFHGKKPKYILDTGVHFGGPWDLFDEAFIRQHLLAARRAYGPERGGTNLLGLIAEVENARWDTRYSECNIAIMPGAWAGLGFALEHVMEVQSGTRSNATVAVIGPTLYQMFHRPIWVYGLNVVAYDFTCSLPHVPLSMDEIAPILEENPRAIVISNPNNPDGVYFPSLLLRQLVAWAEGVGAYIIIDEMQNCFTVDNAGLGYKSWIQSPNVIRLDSPSKRYGLAQYRVGWAIASPKVLGERRTGMVGRMSGLMGNAPKSLDSALRVLLNAELDGETALIAEAKARLASNERHILARLAEIPEVLDIFPREGCVNRAVRLAGPHDDDIQLAEALINRETLFMPGSGYGCEPKDKVLRVTMTAPLTDCLAGLERLAAVLKGT